MLELAGVSAADGDHAPVHVELPDHRCAPFQLWAEGLRRAATQAQQSDQDVLLGVLVGEEGLPAAVGHIVPPYQLYLKVRTSMTPLSGCRGACFPPSRQRCSYLVGSDFVVDFLNAHFSGPHISTLHIFVIALTGQRVRSEFISVNCEILLSTKATNALKTALWVKPG